MRADHRLDARGNCRRCGLRKFASAYCPPGFWMTALERETWDELPESERGPYERWCMSTSQAPSEETKP